MTSPPIVHFAFEIESVVFANLDCLVVGSMSCVKPKPMAVMLLAAGSVV